MPTPIKHLVVLMLENRSFDHMLGFMKSLNPAIDGLSGDEWNYPARELDPNVVVTPDAGDVHDLTPTLTTISATLPHKSSAAAPPTCAASSATTTP